ncbi:MAG: toxin TcdB middle/N-terminal domain-containing protein [Candidatus Promineifilaceae bacterium]
MNQTGASPTATAPPTGDGAVAGMGETFSLDLNSGQGTFSVPFDLPNGIAGFKPTIKLEYSHGRPNGAFGLGWQLQMRQINRRLDLGVPDGAAEVFLDGNVELRETAGGTFKPVREMAFSSYERVGDGWIISEKDGSRQFFGTTATARIAHPDRPDRVQSWLLERHKDVNGNAIEYAYSDVDGYKYLTSITYAKFRVRLTYTARPDVIRSGRAGFVRQITRRCTAITLHLSADNSLIRTLALTYTNASLNNASQLTQLQLTAHGQPDVVKNPLVLSYTTFDPQQIEVRWVESGRGDPVPPPLTDNETTLIALDDLPLPGIITNRNGRHIYWPNDGDGSWGYPRILPAAPFVNSFAAEGVQFIDMDATGSADMLVGIGSNPLNGYYENGGADGFRNFVPYPTQARVLPPFDSGRVRMGDFDGDGVIDALYSTGRGLVNFRNHGRDGWAEPTIAPNVPAIDFADPLTFLADMTGDGMPDIVRVRSGQVEYWQNLGHGRFGEQVIMESSPRLPNAHRNPSQILLLDVDGDGCSDLVQISADGITLYINQAGSRFAPAHNYPVIPLPIPETVRVADVNGRGAAGLLYNSQRAGRTGYVSFTWDQATPAYLMQQVENGMGIVSEFEYAPLVQMALNDRADGRPWDTYMPFPLWLVATQREMDSVRGISAETRYRYHDGHFDPLFRRFQGFRHVEKREIGDASRATVRTEYTFLMNQAATNAREHAHLDRLLAHVAVFSEDNTPQAALPYRVEETDYDLQTLEILPDGTARVFVFVDESRKRYSERTADERIESRRFEYDTFGNVTQEIMRGMGAQNGVSVAEKLVQTDVIYATDATQQLFKAAQTVKRDENGNVLLELRHHYDGLPLGQLDRGLQTREEQLVLSLAVYNAHYGGMDMGQLGYFAQPDADGTPSVFALTHEKTYTAEGNIATESTGGGRSTVTTYDADNLYVVQEIVNGKTHQRINDPISGKPTEMTAHSGAQVRMGYDAFGRLTHYLVANDTLANPTRSIEYDDTSIPNAVATNYRIDANAQAHTVSYFDGHGKEVQKRVERAAGEIVVSGWLSYNGWRQTIAEFEPTLDNTLAFGVPSLQNRAAREVFYDGEGRPIRSVNYNGAVGHIEFSPFEIVTFDARDNTIGSVGFDTPRREQVDVWNQRTTVIEESANGTFIATRFDVGLFGELRELSDDNGVIATYQYDRRGNQFAWTHRDAGLREQWFNNRGEIVRTRDANGNNVTINQDLEGRVTSVLHNGVQVEAFTYDDNSAGSDGRLVLAQYADGQQQFSYSTRGFLQQHTVTVDGQAFTLGYEHNDMGKQSAIIYPDGTRIARQHTPNGMVQRINGIIDDIEYDARNLPTRVDFANGVTTTITYEAGVGHVQNQRTVNGNNVVLEDMAFTYDELMQLIGRNDTAINHNINYAYDPLNQLQHVDGSDTDGNYQFDYTYHNGYNLAQMGESGWQLGYGDAARPDRLTTITPSEQPIANVTYDNNGNITSLPDRTLAYNFKNQLTQVTLAGGMVINYDYDYRGNRVRRRVTDGGVTSEIVMLGRLVEIRAGQMTNFVILNKRRVAILRVGQTRWIHTDSLGNANFFSDENGTKIAQISYHPFGNERSRSGNPLLRTFALHDFDAQVGLVFMGHRWYMPEIGRFLTPDPLYLYQPERSDGDPVQLRLYTYVGNSPTNNVDPQGLSFWSVVGAIVGVVVGIIAAVVVVAAFAVGVGFGVLAVVGLIALVTVSYVIAHNNQGNALGEFFRGFMIGLNAGLNATFLTMMGPVGAFLGGFLGTMIFLGSFDTIASSEVYQGIMGWSNWLMPMSWLVTGAGAIMWILNGLGHLIFWSIPSLWGGGLQFFRIDGFRMDWTTGMLATRGGWISNLNMWDTAFNMGNFAYVDSNSEGWHMDHEAGHNINLAVFGSIFHFVGFIDEVAFSGGGAFAEVLADSNDGGPGMWRV